MGELPGTKPEDDAILQELMAQVAIQTAESYEIANQRFVTLPNGEVARFSRCIWTHALYITKDGTEVWSDGTTANLSEND